MFLIKARDSLNGDQIYNLHCIVMLLCDCLLQFSPKEKTKGFVMRVQDTDQMSPFTDLSSHNIQLFLFFSSSKNLLAWQRILWYSLLIVIACG